MSQHPTYTSQIAAVVLSANDVIATVLLLYEDETYSPLNIATVSLPWKAQKHREAEKDGKALFQRGDLIHINCHIVEHKKAFFEEKDIEELQDCKLSFLSEEEAEVIWKIFQSERMFAVDWTDLEKRDLAKREAKQ